MIGASNQVLQIIQGPQLIQQRPLLAPNHQHQVASTANQQIIAQQTTTTTTLKHNKVPQQILPKPASGTTTTAMAQNIIQQTTTTKTVVTQAKTAMPVPPQPQQFISTQQSAGIPGQGQNTGGQQQGPGQILLPTGATQLNAQPLLLNQLNQMPVIVQQNTPQGVQLILRPQAPQLTTAPASIMIHNTRPQTHHLAQQSQPQQLLRILNTNGTMQLAAAPTFIMSSQANHLIQQNLQTIKTSNGSPTIAQLQGQQNARQGTPQQQQLAAAINNHILGQQLQNLQLNGNLTQLQMPNGLASGQFISQLPPGFTTTTTQATTGININQLANQNLTQIAAAAAASQTFQSPPPPAVTPVNDYMPTIQFNTQPGSGSSGNVTPVACTTPQPQHVISSPSSNLSFGGAELGQNNVIFGGMDHNGGSVMKQMVQEVHPMPIQEQPSHKEPDHNLGKPAKKPKKPRQRKGSTQPPVVSVAPTIMASPPHSPPVQATGKLDLANVMKLCGIMEDDDELESEENAGTEQQQQHGHVEENQTTDSGQQSQIIGQQVSGDSIMITIPGGTEQNPGTMPITFSIPSAMAEEQGLIPGQEGKGDFMITIDPTVSGESQPYTISIPRTVSNNESNHGGQQEKENNHVQSGGQQVKQHCTVAPTIIQPPSVNCSITSTASGMCVPTFVNSVLNSNVTPTLQSQINEIQNQLMAAATPIQTPATVSPPKPKKRAKSKKGNKDKSNDIPVIASVAPMIQNTNQVLTTNANSTTIPNVPTQIGNIQISQVDGTIKNNHINSKNINNQIQITPIMADNKQQIHQIPISSPPVSTTVMTSSAPSPRVQTPINVITSTANSTQLVQSMSHPMMNTLTPMITTNMPQQAIQLQQLQLPTAIQVPQNPTAQQLMQQLTGHLSLSLAEDRRLLLKHDINTPQDAQSQMILQTILSGALGNVTLVHEPSNKQQQQHQQQPKQTMMAQVQPQGHLLPGSIITTSGGNVGHVIPQTQMFPIGAMQQTNNGVSFHVKGLLKSNLH